MKRVILILAVPVILITSCSSIPKKDRVTAVNAQKEKASLFLDRGHNEYRWGSFPSAAHLYYSAFTSASAVDWQEGMIRSLIHLSRTYDRLGEAEFSDMLISKSSELLDGNSSLEIRTMIANRKTEWLLFNATEEEALTLNDKTIQDSANLETEEAGETWRIRASIQKSVKKYDQALDAVLKALSIDQKGNFISETASDYYIMSSIHSLNGNFQKAVDSMIAALDKDKFIENTPAIAQDLFGLGLIYEKYGDSDKANRYFNRSYLVYKGMNRDSVPNNLLEKIKDIPSVASWQKVIDEF